MTNLTAWMTDSFNRGETRALERWVVRSWAARLLISLLTADILFLLAHFLLVFSPLLVDTGFYLDTDGGYGEWFQYLKFGGVIGLLVLLFRRQHTPLYLFWLALFAYLLMDDALRLHEVIGLWLAETAGLPSLLTLRPQDLGEMGFTALIALFFLTMLVLIYQFSRPQARSFSQWLLLALPALAFFGVAADMAQVMTWQRLQPYPFLRELLIVVEESGEMMMVSVVVWLVYRQTERVHGWTAEQIQAWVRVMAVALALFGLLTAVFAAIQAGTPALVGNDGYYHAKMGLLLRQEGLAVARPRLPLTILDETSFYNHHLLYHLYLALFAQTDPALDGGLALTQQVKKATILLAALPFLAVWWLLRGQGVRWPVLWTLALLALSEPFLYRLSMPRAQSASLLLLVLGLHWLLRGRHRLLLPLGAVYVWLYDAFPLLLLLAGVYFTAVALTERRLPWSVLFYPTAGILFGLIANPYFPHNLTFSYHHLLAKLWDSAAIPVGNEWYPYDTWALAQNSGLALALFLLTMLLLNWHGQRLNARLLTLFLLTAVFALMLFRARRFIEYFPAFVLIFAALSLSPLVAGWAQERPLRQRWLLAGCAGLLVLPALHTLRAARALIADSLPADQYAAAALWLKAYSEPGSMIFQTDWDDFTRLFFYNSNAQYTVGLDPTFMARQDPALYAEWVQLTQGEVARPGAVIRERFNADYIFSDLEHETFLQQAAGDPSLREIYRDHYAVIFAVETPKIFE